MLFFGIKSDEPDQAPVDDTPKEKRLEIFLEKELQMDVAQVQRMREKFPSVLTCSEVKLTQTIQFLRQELSYSDADIRRVIQSLPQALKCSVDDNLKPTVSYLLDFFDGNMDSTRSVVLRFPPILVYSVEGNLKPKVDFLNDLFNGCMDSVRSIILKEPQFMGRSLEKKIKPMIGFLTDDVYFGDLSAVQSAVLKHHPSLFVPNLERTKYRFRTVMDRGIDPKTISLGFLQISEKKFEKWLGNREKEILQNKSDTERTK